MALQGCLKAVALLRQSAPFTSVLHQLGAVNITRNKSTVSPSFNTEQDQKNYDILLYLMQRPVDTAMRVGALAGLGAAYRDLSAVMDHMLDKDERGFNYPEIAKHEAENTLNNIKALRSEQPDYQEACRQLKLHLQTIIPELANLSSAEARAAAHSAVSLFTEHDQLALRALYPELQLAVDQTDSSTPSTTTTTSSSSSSAAVLHTLGEASNSSSSTTTTGTERQGEVIGRLGQRLACARFPVWDVTRYDDDSHTGQVLRPRYMDKLSCWQALLPPHLEVSYQTMTAIPLFPMQEAVYPTFVDFDLAMNYLSRFARRNRR